MEISLVIGLVVAAMVFFVLEILTPTFGALVALGLAALAGAIWAAFTVHFAFGLAMLGATLVGVPLYLVWIVRVLPKTVLGRRLFLGRAREATGDAAPEARTLKSLVGKRGVADSLLRPSGTVRIEGKRVVAVAERGTIPKGTTVTVTKAEGTDVIVRPVEDESPEAT